MIRSPDLDHLPQLALLRSAGIAHFVRDQLKKPETQFADPLDMEKKLFTALKSTVFAPHVRQLRQDDATAASCDLWKRSKGDNGLYTFDFLRDLARHHLFQTRGAYQVKHSNLTDYCELIREVHPAFLIGIYQVDHLLRGEIKVKALEEGLTRQCSLALPPTDPDHPHADNHVHLGAVGITSQPLMALIANQGKIVSEPAVALDPWLGMTDDFGFQTLDRLLGATAYYILEYACNPYSPVEQDAEQRRQLKEGKRKFAPSRMLIDRLSVVSSRTIPQELALIMARCLNRNDAGGALQMFVTLALYVYRDKPSPLRLRLSVLGFVHAVNLIRSAIIMTGVGLEVFVKYYASPLRSHGKKFAENDFWGQLIGNGVNMVDAKLSSVTPEEFKKHAKYAAKSANKFADLSMTPSDVGQRYHFSYHFSRSLMGDKKPTSTRQNNRFASERSEVNGKALELRRQLSTLVKGEEYTTARGAVVQNLMSWLRCFDVAGDETKVPIEVFAPALRWLRDKPLIQNVEGENVSARRNFSIHAGEDFSNLLSGIRHVEETVLFCDLGEDDRIGHGLALGLDPHVWAERQKSAITPLQAHVDNLVWFHHHAVCLAGRVDLAGRVLPALENRLNFFLSRLFGKHPPSPGEMYRAWKLRKNCPAHIFGEKKTFYLPDDRYWVPDFQKDLELQDSSEYKEFQRYHSLAWKDINKIKKRDENVRVSLGQNGEASTSPDGLHDYLSPDDLDLLVAIQDDLLTEIDRRGIIIEACPTSNVSISRLKGYEEHPIFRWRPVNPDLLNKGAAYNRFGLRPGAVKVCLNTDDPAIFPTTIATEHFLIREAAIKNHAASRAEAEDWIDKIRIIGVDLFRRTNKNTELVISPLIIKKGGLGHSPKWGSGR